MDFEKLGEALYYALMATLTVFIAGFVLLLLVAIAYAVPYVAIPGYILFVIFAIQYYFFAPKGTFGG